ncbi:unnamed protein product [Bemisia tabaci]|uniref:Large ribosomal subunit protein eL33 n=1 Tax=Bemisia tabaci TaxID=7038 RepID=A0A9P0F2F5_BEMTA|nr:PREDICTED: 60S ribosomal protein L35a [Bemisia tabaci]CAH0386048.1 unnamed protein product [Bemisia tabaci]
MAPADKKKLVKPAVREPLRRPKKPKVKKEKVVKKEEPPKPKVKKPVNPRHFRPRKRHEPKRLLKLKKKDEREVPARFLGGRLFAKAIFTGYKRGQRQQHEKYALLRVEGCKKKKDLQFYVGKKCIFVYKAHKNRKMSVSRHKTPSKIRAIWGKVTRPHGSSTTVRAKFKTNLPPRAMGKAVRIMLYPSRI